MELTLHGRPLQTVFDLLGKKENDLTFSLGWALANVPAFTTALMHDVLGSKGGEVQSILLQERDANGITDIEILTPKAHLIIEAKRAWEIPGIDQLQRYAGRLMSSQLPIKRLLALTDSSNEFARLRLPEQVTGIQVDHRSWADMVAHANTACHGTGTHQERHLARQLVTYLRGVTTVQDLTSNISYCVSLGATYAEVDRPLTPREVLERNIYFHPFGWNDARWPKVPDNFLALRWSGHIQQVRHVERTEVVADLHSVIPEFPSLEDPDRPYLVYYLGSQIPLPAPLPSGVGDNGKRINYQSNRFRVAVDLILTCGSVREAIDQTRLRLNGS